MNRTLIAIALVAASASAFADDITIETTPFRSTATRAEVQAELTRHRAAGVNPWSNQYNPLARFESRLTRAEVKADYINARDRVAAFTAEDSGSAWLAAHRGTAAPAQVAGQPRSAQ